jgi:hypothetical protein
MENFIDGFSKTVKGWFNSYQQKNSDKNREADVVNDSDHVIHVKPH